MKKITQLIKKIIGTKVTRTIRPFYHGIRTYLGAIYYGFPAKKLKVIGITGTKGKTTTTVFCGRILNMVSVKTGYISSSVINTGQQEFLNKYKMSSLDGVLMHKYLKEMVDNGCKVAVIEMTSQGLEQNRHFGIGGFDVAVFLNLYPEHLEAHGGWENYRKAKAILFKNLKKEGYFIGNEDDWETDFMWQNVKHKDSNRKKLISSKDYRIIPSKTGIFKQVQIQNKIFDTQLIGDFDIANTLFAIYAASLVGGVSVSELLPNIKNLQTVPGRMDFVIQHQTVKNIKDLSILVDYAHEPESMKQLLQTIENWKKQGFFEKVIHVLSADGAGRDDWKKPIMGQLSFKKTDFTVITTDNYDERDSPHEILDLLAQNCLKKEEGKKFFKIVNRRLAMQKALEIASTLANQKVLIVSTGVGSEQGLTQPHGIIEWDEKTVWQELVQEFVNYSD